MNSKDGVGAVATNDQTDTPPKMIAGFWIRAAADVLDMAILWVFAFVLSFVMEGWFFKLGENGVWFGLLISIAYFVPTQSTFGNGQSLGKRLLGVTMDALLHVLHRRFVGCLRDAQIDRGQAYLVNRQRVGKQHGEAARRRA